MTRVAQHLRLELAQARDLLSARAADKAALRQQRTRAAAVDMLLVFHQLAGRPLRLSHEIVLLHAISTGHLDCLAALFLRESESRGGAKAALTLVPTCGSCPAGGCGAALEWGDDVVRTVRIMR